MQRLELFAPAKINLTLDVLGKRTDGFHELATIMQTISLGDCIMLDSARDITVHTDNPEIPSGADNLAYRAACLLRDYTDAGKGVHIDITKRIPVAAGLAGGSADAAAVLRGLNQLWDLQLTVEELYTLAGKLGSDVAFCMFGGTVLGEGRGERLTVLPALPNFGVILVNPPIGVSTQAVYQRVNIDQLPQPMTPVMLKALRGGDREEILTSIGNMLECVTINMHPEIAVLKEDLRKAGARAVLMSGSGPTVFGLTENITEAQRVADKLRGGKEQVFVAEMVHTY